MLPPPNGNTLLIAYPTMYAPHTSRHRIRSPGYAARSAAQSARERSKRYSA